MAFLNPVKSWHEIRDSSAMLESAIWQFRTRTGPFILTSHGHSSTQATNHLRQCVLEASSRIVSSVKETAYQKQWPMRIFRHEQYSGGVVTGVSGMSGTADTSELPPGKANAKASPHEQHGNSPAAPELVQEARIAVTDLDPQAVGAGRGAGGGDAAGETRTDDETQNAVQEMTGGEKKLINDHQSPLDSEGYICHRIEPIVKFYKSRLPVYGRVRNCLHYFLIFGAFSGAILAHAQQLQYVAIITAITSGVTTWLEFHRTSEKISRYNASITNLSSLLLWWQSIRPPDRALSSNIEYLVQGSENIINQERTSWRSSGKATSVNHAVENESNEKDKKAKAS